MITYSGNIPTSQVLFLLYAVVLPAMLQVSQECCCSFGSIKVASDVPGLLAGQLGIPQRHTPLSAAPLAERMGFNVGTTKDRFRKWTTRTRLEGRVQITLGARASFCCPEVFLIQPLICSTLSLHPWVAAARSGEHHVTPWRPAQSLIEDPDQLTV